MISGEIFMTYNQQISLLIEASADCTEPDLKLFQQNQYISTGAEESGWFNRARPPEMAAESNARRPNIATARAEL